MCIYINFVCICVCMYVYICICMCVYINYALYLKLWFIMKIIVKYTINYNNIIYIIIYVTSINYIVYLYPKLFKEIIYVKYTIQMYIYIYEYISYLFLLLYKS